MHQMRGQVGRSNKKAFCYLITTPHHMMSDNARKRLQALELFSDLGSGLNIAMKDLEIRGAGDLLGGDEWFINDIGLIPIKKSYKKPLKNLKKMV